MKNKTLTIIASSALAAVLVIGPAAAFAKSDKSGANLHGRVTAQASTTASVTCPTRAFGHLIGRGWAKKHDATSVSSTCPLPFGIAYKLGFALHPTPATTTPDTTAPVISTVHVSTSTSSATVTWQTDEPATTQLAYGTTTSYGSTSVLNGTLGFLHSVTISGLAASTTYHFHVLSKDAKGNLVSSSDASFTTSAPADTTAPTLSAINVSNVGSTTAIVNWTTNEPSTSKVYFTSGNSLDLGTAHAVSGTALLTSHAVTLGGLSASTTYSYAVQSQDAFGNTATSGTTSFTTSL